MGRIPRNLAAGIAAAMLSMASLSPAAVTDISGDLTAPLDQVVGPGNDARLVGNAKTLWHAHTSSANVDLNGFKLTIDTGNGNAHTYNGAITGPGMLELVGRFDASFSPDIRLGGANANAPDSVAILQGRVTLNKASGVDALAGPITFGGNDPSLTAIMEWNASHQINDASAITTGSSTVEFRMQGHSETFGALALNGRGYLDLGAGNSQVRFADSSAAAWGAGKTLLVKNWAGEGTNGVTFGGSAAALTSAQVSSVGFIDPAGFNAGLYRAKILANGELAPDVKVEPIDPPFDVSPEAITARAQLYSATGRANLSGENTPLAAGTKISVFGDSITWQNGFISRMQTALNEGAGTAELNVQVINRGINGGGVIQVRDGSANASYPGDSAQASFADVIAADGADIAVVFIGINDVWWRGTTAEQFRGALEDIADQAAAADVKLVFATPTVRFEMPDGSNPNDAAIDEFSQIMRDVADEKGAALVDLRAAYVAYEQNHNWELQLDGSLIFQNSGILTYDGVHPTNAGNELLADLISQGIYEAAAIPEPAATSLFTAGGLFVFFGRRR